jgi:MinD-like ATPase involved in chromosome partitioning or flagellar assembly
MGVLDDTASVTTTGIGIIGGTAQVSVVLPQQEDDDLTDEAIIDGEIDEAVVADLVMDETPAAVQTDSADPIAESTSAIESPEEPIVETSVPETDEVPVSPASTADASRHDDGQDDLVSTKSVTLRAAREYVAAAVPSALKPAAAPTLKPAADPKPAAEPKPVPASKPVPAPKPVPASKPIPSPTTKPVADLKPVPTSKAVPVSEPASATTPVEEPAPAVVSQSVPAVVPQEVTPVNSPSEKPTTPKPAAPEHPRAAARAAAVPAAKRLDELGDSARESADLLTADRLLDPHRLTKPEPEGAWSHLLYSISGRRINIGDGRRARERKALTARIAAPLTGGARFVPVLSRKGGVGKTAITALLGMALADARDDRVIAVDANPDRGTLADRIVRTHHTKSVRDLVRIRDEVKGYHDISAIVARDATRLDVLASDTDPHIAEAFSDSDYRDVAGIAAHYYSLVLTDTGTGIVHSVMSATLDLADQIVIVSGLSVDQARLASETLTWLETNGYTDQARNAIVVLNHSTPGVPLVRVAELETHFRTRVRRVVQMPYDAQIAAGGAIVFANLQPETRLAARELAALLVEGLRAEASA